MGEKPAKIEDLDIKSWGNDEEGQPRTNVTTVVTTKPAHLKGSQVLKPMP